MIESRKKATFLTFISFLNQAILLSLRITNLQLCFIAALVLHTDSQTLYA